jgi:3',5'-cyclic AMP phosphodiesterase CpdA
MDCVDLLRCDIVLFFFSSDVEGGGFATLEQVQKLFEYDAVMFAAWVHYLAFDLFVGLWIAEQSQLKSIHRLIQIPILAATFLLGPFGLLLFFSHWKFWFWYFGIIDLLKKEKANRMTTILIKSAQVIDIESAHHGKQTDIYIKDGMIEAMGTDLEVQADKELNASGLVANTGWLDILSYCGEPGEEWKEDLNSFSRAAQSGGFTHVAVLAGNHPHPDHAAAISAYVLLYVLYTQTHTKKAYQIHANP